MQADCRSRSDQLAGRRGRAVRLQARISCSRGVSVSSCESARSVVPPPAARRCARVMTERPSASSRSARVASPRPRTGSLSRQARRFKLPRSFVTNVAAAYWLRSGTARLATLGDPSAGHVSWRGVGRGRTERGSGHPGAENRRTSSGFDETRRQRWPVPEGMTIQEVVKQVLLNEHADVIREAVRPSARS